MLFKIGYQRVQNSKQFFVHGLTSSEIDDMWLKIGEDHNCDTFYFAIVQSLTAFSDMIRRIFRLE